ncbi:TPA: alkaline phosphatase family protein [Shewanella algae]|uniref:alkaline phosphatase family protein n=1 Tax=Shewanella algae TaxID=38313 RepID=UPI001C59612D|nr:alkaline phosphatase family protein [Shewanella algae]HDS1207144.1 alkaline phosphatase family protein [Shewanella algae]
MKLKEEYHYCKVKPSFGFCERSEIFSGLTPLQSNNFTAIGHDPENSPFKKLAFILKLLHKVLPRSQDSFIHRNTRRLINKILKKLGFGLGCYRIPLCDLADYRLTEDQYDLTSVRNEAFYPFIQRAGGIDKVFLTSFTSLSDKISLTDDQRIQLCLESASNKSYKKFLVYISTADALGHKYGPDSKNLFSALTDLDRKLESFYNQFLLKRNDVSFVFIGDHGMAKVNTKVNFANIVDNIALKHDLKYREDYKFFLDSTIARIWFMNDRASLAFHSELKCNHEINQAGRIIEFDDYQSYGIPNKSRLYGDIVWIANTGTLIWPDFFHNNVGNSPLGMHGYYGDSSELIGFYLDTGNSDKSNQKSDYIYLHSIYNSLV